jgi:hypothetical protein
MTTQQNLLTCAQVEAIFLTFDSHYYLHGLHDVVDKRLEAFAANVLANKAEYRTAQNNYAALAASWARLVVRVDLTYKLAEAYDIFESVNELAGSTVRSSPLSKQPQLSYHIVARWHDGVGKLFYRIGKHAHAREHWEKAINVLEEASAKRHSLQFLRPDIVSNLIRNEFEEEDQPNSAKDSREARKREMRERLDSEINDQLAYWRMTHPSIHELLATSTDSSSELAKHVSALSCGDKERLTGLASLYHNHGNPGMALRIARATGNEYRRLQARHDEALAKKRDLMNAMENSANGSFADRSNDIEAIWKEIEKSHSWIRGRYLAEQNRLVLQRDMILHKNDNAQFAQVAGIFKKLKKLIDAIQIANPYAKCSDGNEIVKDTDLHGWTTIHLRNTFNLLCQLAVEQHQETERENKISEMKNTLMDEIREFLTQHRAAVTVSTYRKQFSFYFSAFYEELLGCSLEQNSDNIGQLVKDIEKYTAQELIDLLEVSNQSSS